MADTPRGRIPYVDLRGEFTPLDLVFLQRARARAMVEAVKDTFGAASRAPSDALLRMADRASRRWLKQSDNPYWWEIGRMAEEIGISGVLTLNVALEWSCTGGVWQTASGPVLRRVLDWPLPRLGEFLVVLHLSGKAGGYYDVTWPGLAGVFHEIGRAHV